MDFTAIGNMNQFLKATHMKTIWKQKQDSTQSAIPGAPKSSDHVPGMSQGQGDPRLSEIIMRLQTGQDLTSADLEYLREHSPEAYEAAVKAIREKKQYEEDLRGCKTKDEARILQLGKVAEAFSIAKDAMARGDVAACAAAGAKLMMMSAAYAEFTKSSDYAELAENYAELADALKAVEEELFGGENAESAEETNNGDESQASDAEQKTEDAPESPAPAERDARISGGEFRAKHGKTSKPAEKSVHSERAKEEKAAEKESCVYPADKLSKVKAAKRKTKPKESYGMEPVFQSGASKISLKI